MTVRIMVDIYEPKELRATLADMIRAMNLEFVEGDRRQAGADFVIDAPQGEVWIERKTISDMFSALTRNIYEHGKPKPEGRERRLFTQLLKLKGDKRTPILLIEGPFPDDEIKRHTLIGVEEWCIRNGIFVIHTANMDDTAYALKRMVQKLIT